jgi:ATP-dependent exoDNAse (exonuclease V) alpha subunit
VALAHGNRASVGDVIITRANDRRLRLTPTDWVKNGDRWTIIQVARADLTVRHNRSHHTVRVPADYVCTSTGLGYATTIHAAQGVTAETMHGLLTGDESRQQLYTMLTRGRAANHLYLEVVSDGDPHTLIRPDTVAPRTPTELLR